MKKLLAGVLSFCIMLSATACTAGTNASTSSAASSSGPVTVTDTAGNIVQVPSKINRIAEQKANAEAVMILGYGSKIVALGWSEQSHPWMFKVDPALNNALVTSGNDFNAEALAAKKPDIVFLQSGDANAAKIKSLGILAVQFSFQSYADIEKSVSLTAKVLGADAQKRADKYNAYLNATLTSIKKQTASIPETQKPKVLHIASLNPLEVDGSNTLINDWITAAGGVNAAQGVTGNMKQVSMEQILKWNPDIVIVGVGGADAVKNNAQWASVKAVQNGKVYSNPVGVFGWDRYSPEVALQFQWAAQTFYPDKFKNIHIGQAVKDYYKTFLNYTLTDDDVTRILNAQPPKN